MTPMFLIPLLLSLAPAQQYVTAAEESFVYPVGSLHQQAGGTGWANPWYVDNNGLTTACMVATPGFDAAGERASTQYEHGGSYRLIDAAPHAAVTDNGVFGRDGTTVWISFRCQRDINGDQWYGTLGLFWQWNGSERLAMGSPWGADMWGWDVPFQYQTPVFVNGTNVDVMANLVYRIDFLPGDEHVRLWVDPATAHPTTAPDADDMVPDFRFNEVRIQSGSGGPVGFSFDSIKVEYELQGPDLALAGTCPGVMQVSGSGMTPNGRVYVAYGIGTGAYTLPNGSCAGATFGLNAPALLRTLRADGSGAFSFNGNAPAGACGVVKLQALDYSSCQLSNVVGP